MKSSLRSLIAVTLLFSGSVNAIGSSSNSQAADRVAQRRDKWLAAFKSKDVTSAVVFYTSDAAFLQPTGDRIEGSKAIRELYEKVVSTFDTDLTLTSRFLEASGSLACDSGEYEETLTNRATSTSLPSAYDFPIPTEQDNTGGKKYRINEQRVFEVRQIRHAVRSNFSLRRSRG